MNVWANRFVRLAIWLVVGTGVIYFALKYLVAPTDPYAVINHRWQPTWQHLHVIAAPLLVFAGGLLWQEHVVRRWRMGPKGRFTGTIVATLFIPMVSSGYLMQVAVAEPWRLAWVWVHSVSSAVWVVVYALHGFGAARRRYLAPPD